MSQFINAVNFIFLIFWLTITAALVSFGIPPNVDLLINSGSISIAWIFLSQLLSK